jgi:hypothetical protein
VLARKTETASVAHYVLPNLFVLSCNYLPTSSIITPSGSDKTAILQGFLPGLTITGRAQAPDFSRGVSEPLQLKCLPDTPDLLGRMRQSRKGQ